MIRSVDQILVDIENREANSPTLKVSHLLALYSELEYAKKLADLPARLRTIHDRMLDTDEHLRDDIITISNV